MVVAAEEKELIIRMWNEGKASREIADAVHERFGRYVTKKSIKNRAHVWHAKGENIQLRVKGWNMKHKRLAQYCYDRHKEFKEHGIGGKSDD